MKSTIFMLLVVLTANIVSGQTAATLPKAKKPTALAAQESAAVYGTLLGLENTLPKQLKAVNILSFDDISDVRKQELKEDCRILDRLINKALPNIRQNTLGVNVNHTATGRMSYIAGKGFILNYDLPYSLTVVGTKKKEEPKKELSDWEKARDELNSNKWRYGVNSQQMRGVLFYEAGIKQVSTLSAPKISDMKTAIAKVLTNVKNMRAASGETVTVFVNGKATNVNGKLARSVVAFEVKIASDVSEKDVRSRVYSENVQIVSTKGNTFLAR